ncbi:hypothetical protein L226DRAFT_370651 [Lentinus tigrinus ALCF2SS1-7]|uniref:Uncharacterized protein n=1 Tax=Lentinus tigrinus ALCF2SS1-6 TaxID=1328759 RepID=A0A5C2SJP0_9APHY|nr:hypothetical protein L227DRAFT_315812 [Lentinus tigrinus ALCF2SS1-6]RPD76235.1 hypothetical protein L226DRAFT_370651 [Lentinus tigrinus ALCF2SS1-7]
MSAQYDLARPAKQVYPMDTTRLHMASKTASYLPPKSNLGTSSTRGLLESASLPQTSWLSDAGDFELPSSLAFPSSSRMQSRHTPSPIPSPSRTLHPSRSFTASSSHKSSGMSSDRDASGHLDIKRLMSKPARQTPSGSVSLLSDSERSLDASSSRMFSHPPLSRSATASREKMSLHVNTTGLRSSSAPRPSPPGTRSSSGSRPGHASSPERRPAIGDGQPGKPRNVLRRRTSARSNPSTPSAAVTHARAATDDSLPPSRSLSTRHQQAYLRDDMPFSAYYSTRPTNSPSTSAPRPSTSPRTKVTSPKPPRSPQVASGLTPAGAVALAYKQQEQRREELAETAAFNDAYQPPSTPLAASAPNPPSNLDLEDEENEEGSGPYYTVFGSSSGRLVAVGSPEDQDWHYDPRAHAPLNGKPVGTRSLSRKVSGPFKRVTGSIRRERDHRDLGELSREVREEHRHADVFDGTYGRSSPSNAQMKVHRKPITLDTSLDGRNSPRDSPTTKFSPANKGSPSPQEDGRASRSSRLKGKDREDEMSPGGKWWKLMKRISTGGLREKYQHDPAPPPVPALPQYISPAPGRTTMDITTSRDAQGHEVSENGVLLRKFMQSRASMSGVRPSLSAPSKASSGGSSRPSTSTGTVGRPSTGNTTKSRASISGHRPSTATRSSSPGSSDLALSGFSKDHRTPSTHSSISSMGEEIPPVPKNVGRYIVPPSELSRMTKSREDVSTSQSKSSHSKTPRTPARSHTAPADTVLSTKDGSSPEDRSTPSLPLPPPRRAATTGSATSPLAPTFNVEDTINNLMPPQPAGPPPLTEFGMKEPPPRPKRSSRRALPPTNVEVPARSQSVSATTAQSLATRHSPPQVRVDIDLIRRPSIGAMSYASTAKQVSTGSSNSPASGLSPHSNSPGSALSQSNSPSSAVSKRSPLTFRELDSPRQRLTEKEKADKWEDLLARSARAGGTLHIGESQLMSESTDVSGDDSFFNGSDSD